MAISIWVREGDTALDSFPWHETTMPLPATLPTQSWCLTRYSSSLLADTQTENRLMAGAVSSYPHFRASS